LAIEHKKSKWGYGSLGIATYYLGTILVGTAIGIIDAIAETNYVEETEGQRKFLGIIHIKFWVNFP